MGAQVSRTDFEWVHTDNHHSSRRKIILERFPEIKQLYGYDPMTKWIVTLLVIIQLVSLPLVQHLGWPVLVVVAYCFGGVINHLLMIVIHEISHNYAFGQNRLLANKLLGIFANLPIGIPLFISFKNYHSDHHKYTGEDTLDVDLPMSWEAKLFCTTGRKFVWLVLQPLFYFLRPLLLRPKSPTYMEFINVAVQLLFNAFIVELFGWKVLGYLLIGLPLTMGLHPFSGHLVAEHYMFRQGFETYSYYGPLNWITRNSGYHNEHHDFPAIPSNRLPEVKRIAGEFYDNMPHHNSWVKVLYDFVCDPEIGPYARVKRKERRLDN